MTCLGGKYALTRIFHQIILDETLANLIDKDLTTHGVSIINVGGTGLRRYSRILQRKNLAGSYLSIPVACITDMDVMPDCAPQILDLVEDDNDQKWTSSKRRWQAIRDFGNTPAEQAAKLAEKRANLQSGDGQNVHTFVADHWTPVCL